MSEDKKDIKKGLGSFLHRNVNKDSIQKMKDKEKELQKIKISNKMRKVIEQGKQ